MVFGTCSAKAKWGKKIAARRKGKERRKPPPRLLRRKGEKEKKNEKKNLDFLFPFRSIFSRGDAVGPGRRFTRFDSPSGQRNIAF